MSRGQRPLRGAHRQEALSKQTIGFATSRDGVRIAYALSGRGAPLVKTANWLTHIDYDRRSPVWLHWLEFLSAHAALLRYDERGNGLSDHEVEDLSFARWVDDLESLIDHVGFDRFSLLGISQGGAVALQYAARHPDRVDRIVLCGAYAVGWARRRDQEERRRTEALLELVEYGWGAENPAYRKIFANLFAPDADDEQTHSFAELQRLSTEPKIAARLIEAMGDIDIRSCLEKVRAPTLVMHARHDARVPFDEGRKLAASIPGAKLIPLETRNHALLADDPAWQTFTTEFRSFFGIDSLPSETSLAIPAEYGELTRRERAVAAEVAAGLDNAEIGRRLGISEKTVRNHLIRIFDKVGVRSRAQLIVRIRDSADS